MKLLELVTGFLKQESRITELEQKVAELTKELEYFIWQQKDSNDPSSRYYQDRKGDRK